MRLTERPKHMIPDIASTLHFRTSRITDTIEDALVLLRFRAPDCFAKHNLEKAEEQIHQASREAWSGLLRDPKVAMWSLVDLTILMERPDSPEALRFAEEIAEQIKYIALGAANLDRRVFTTFVKLPPSGTYIPGTGISLVHNNDGSEVVAIGSDPSGAFLINDVVPTTGQWQSISGFIIPAGDPLFIPPKLDGYELTQLDTAIISLWETTLTRMRPLLDASPEAASLVDSFGSLILPLKASTSGAHLSVSFKHRPGIVYASWSEYMPDVLEAIVHESDHQCLYEVVNEDALFTCDAINSRAIFRSPWRSDPRPLSGLFFGFSAFVSVGVFWSKLLRKGLVDQNQAGKRAVLTLEQSLDAISVCTSEGGLTERGKHLLEYNRSEALSALRILENSQGFREWKEASIERRDKDAARWRTVHRGANVVATDHQV